MFATVDAAAAVESRFADLGAALAAEATALNTAGGEAFQRGQTTEARRLLKAAGASAKLREKIRALQAERAPAATEQTPSPVLFAPRPPSIPQEGSTTPVAQLSVPRAALLAAALPVLRMRKARRSGKVSVTFADGHVAFDCGSAAFTAPATGSWPGVAIVPAKVVFAWVQSPPDRCDPIALRVENGDFHFHHMRAACHWEPRKG